MTKPISINQRISINIIEMAIKAALDGIFTSEYASELAAGDFQGANRIAKARSWIGKLSERNPLFPFIKEHQQEYMQAIKYKGDRALVFTALINATFGFAYDTTALMGKFFHVQDIIPTTLLQSKLSVEYGSNRSLPNALYALMPMYIDAGLIIRPKIGEYQRNMHPVNTDFAKEIYIQSFFINNPNLIQDFSAVEEHPYFEFLYCAE